MRRRRRFVDMAGPVEDPHTKPLTGWEKIGALVLAVEIILGLFGAALILPEQLHHAPTSTSQARP